MHFWGQICPGTLKGSFVYIPPATKKKNFSSSYGSLCAEHPHHPPISRKTKHFLR